MAGNNGDYYLNTATGDLFLKTAGVWNKVGNLKGNTGDSGPKGDVGDKGDTGAKGDSGETGGKGDKGDAGAAGASWLNGASDPS
jgi:hypothetical protein